MLEPTTALAEVRKIRLAPISFPKFDDSGPNTENLDVMTAKASAPLPPQDLVVAQEGTDFFMVLTTFYGRFFSSFLSEVASFRSRGYLPIHPTVLMTRTRYATNFWNPRDGLRSSTESKTLSCSAHRRALGKCSQDFFLIACRKRFLPDSATM